jgi:uncharacterized membrane protein
MSESKAKKTMMAGGLVLGLGAAMMSEASAAPDWANKIGKAVKCAGVAKKGMNDCGVKGGHSCSNQAKKDNDPKEWVYVPTKKLCDKIGGKVIAKKTF